MSFLRPMLTAIRQPRSLFARLTLVWVITLLLGHFAEAGLYRYHVLKGDKSTTSYYLAKDLATVLAIMDRLALPERSDWLLRLQRGHYEFHLGKLAPGVAAHFGFAAEISQAVQNELGQDFVFSVLTPTDSGLDLVLNTQLHDGTPLSVAFKRFSQPASNWYGVFFALQLLTLIAFTWFAVRQATQPLKILAQSAEVLGASLSCEPLPERGPAEVAQAAVAFNAMRQRILDHLAERMHILAAISHDLQTPLTRMRLRADLLDDAEQRNKWHADLHAMQALVEEGISYARSAHSHTETPCRIDLYALLDSTVCDYLDAGQALRLKGDFGQPLQTRPLALKRIVCNLIDNALKYATAVEIIVKKENIDRLNICVCDRGPGLPESELLAVMQPFYRLEGSRNRDSGGTGLGLAIAQQLALALQASLTLSNRAGGGLEAKLTLPLSI